MENETLKILKTRRSIRKFNDCKIPDHILKQILEAGTYAPTGMNRQSPHIIVFNDEDQIKELGKINTSFSNNPNRDPFYGAKTVILVIAEKLGTTYIQDGSAVITNIINAAWSLGVGSCWIHRAKEEIESQYGKSLLEKLNLKGEYVGIGHVALGYFDEENPSPKPRKDNYIIYVKD